MSQTKGTSANEDYALVLLVKEILDQLDELCALRKAGSKGAISHELLREMCSVLPELSETLQARYFEILISTSTKTEMSRKITASEEIVVASVSPKRKTLRAISEKLGIKAA